MLKKKRTSNLAILGLIVVLPACYKKLGKKPTLHHYDKQPVLTQQAHLTDIPLPIQAEVRELHGATHTSSGLTFVSTFCLADLVRFYELEMERLGWKELHLFSVESEVLLVFEKPERFCTVSIRPDNRVVIFFGSRE